MPNLEAEWNGPAKKEVWRSKADYQEDFKNLPLS